MNRFFGVKLLFFWWMCVSVAVLLLLLIALNYKGKQNYTLNIRIRQLNEEQLFSNKEQQKNRIKKNMHFYKNPNNYDTYNIHDTVYDRQQQNILIIIYDSIVLLNLNTIHNNIEIDLFGALFSPAFFSVLDSKNVMIYKTIIEY